MIRELLLIWGCSYPSQSLGGSKSEPSSRVGRSHSNLENPIPAEEKLLYFEKCIDSIDEGSVKL